MRNMTIKITKKNLFTLFYAVESEGVKGTRSIEKASVSALAPREISLSEKENEKRNALMSLPLLFWCIYQEFETTSGSIYKTDCIAYIFVCIFSLFSLSQSPQLVLLPDYTLYGDP